MLEELKEQVRAANVRLVREGLARVTWGNASGRDRAGGLVVIKPSGMAAEQLRVEDMVVLDLGGKVVEGRCRPSTDTATHLELYRAWPEIGGVVHTHSLYATMFAQALKPIPCLGTTHADYFHGEVPLTRELTPAEVNESYEANTGRVIVERFRTLSLPEAPGVLVARHGPFAWGRDAAEAVENAGVMELLAQMAHGTLALNAGVGPAPGYLVDKHYNRKHGAGAYYGQKGAK